MATEAAQRELVITRVFDAPRELVFQMWTDPQHLAKWWGPRDYPVGPLSMDARPGSKWRNCLMSNAGDMSLWHSGTFREVVPPKRLVFTFRWEEEGERGMENVVTITFTEQNGKTLMNFRQAPFYSDPECDGHGVGWNSSFDRLDEYLLDRSNA